MRINHNIAAMNATRQHSNNLDRINKSMSRLSSGLRINSTADDAAGLSISEKMRGQIRGASRASANAQDAISFIQTAEGALNEVHELLQRGRVLSVAAANGTNTTSDRKNIQAELDHIISEVDRVANSTEFNTIKMLNKQESDATSDAIITGLKSGWLESSMSLINTYYGLTPSNRALGINIVDGSPGGTLAYVASSWSGGVLNSLDLFIEKSDFSPATGPDGLNSYGTMYDDRIIAHEMVHAVFADQLGANYSSMPTWFNEGSAEYIHGADERLSADLAINGAANIVSLGTSLINGLAWPGNSEAYSAGYLVVKYLDSKQPGSFKDFINDIKNSGFNTALTNARRSTRYRSSSGRRDWTACS